MRLDQHRLTPWALAALLSLGLGRNGAAQTSNLSDTVVAVETVELTVYRTKKPSKAPAVRAWVLPVKYGYPPSLQADQMSQLDISQ